MSKFLSKKLSFILLLCAYCVSAAVVLLLHYALSGPKLGRFYDKLLGFRAPPPVSGEILLIETSDIVEPGDVFSVLMVLSEMSAADIVIEVPQVGSGTGRVESGEEFTFRINDEFGLLEKNIRGLFEAITLGLIPPEESAAYVNELIELAERGRDRLNTAIVRQDEAGSVQAAQAAAVFGRVFTAVDLRGQDPENMPWYSRPRPGRDRTLRRIAPVIRHGEKIISETDHIVYRALKSRWAESNVELTENGGALVNRFVLQGEVVVDRFPLDSDGNILFDRREKNDGFRSVTLDQFNEYDKVGREMEQLLKEAEALGVYAETMPERMPLFLCAYADSLKEELLIEPDREKLAAWITAREDYMLSLDEFLYGPSEMIFVNGYEELIAGEGLGEEGITAVQQMRDGLIRSFVDMREKYRELTELRSMLADEIKGSFCIMRPVPSARTVFEDSSAMLANALLTVSCITPGHSRYIIFWSLLAALTVLACIFPLRPLYQLLAGSAASLVTAAVFSFVFVAGGYWIDPLIPSVAVLAGVFIISSAGFCISYGRELRFRLAYSPVINSKMLKKLIKAGRPSLMEAVRAHTAVIAVKNPSFSGMSGTGNPLEAATASAEFRAAVSFSLMQAGAAIIRCSGDTVLACFGSPPERLCTRNVESPAQKAVNFVSLVSGTGISGNFSDRPAGYFSNCVFGIESGECVFFYSAETGYTADGAAVRLAPMLASASLRFNIKAAIGEHVKTETAIEAREIAIIQNMHAYGLPGS